MNTESEQRIIDLFVKHDKYPTVSDISIDIVKSNQDFINNDFEDFGNCLGDNEEFLSLLFELDKRKALRLEKI